MGDGRANERSTRTRPPRWWWVSVLLLLSVPTCAQFGTDSMRVLEWHLPPVIPMRWWSTVALFVAVCFVLVAWEARRASGWQRLAVVAAS